MSDITIAKCLCCGQDMHPTDWKDRLRAENEELRAEVEALRNERDILRQAYEGEW